MIKQAGLVLGLAALTAACSDGGSSRSSPPPPVPVSGVAVKGPLTGAAVTAFALDPAAADLKGASLGSGETDANAQITGLELPQDTTGYVLLEYTADADTVDLTTGAAPVLDVLTTYAAASDVLAGETLYATALTTMALDIAADNAGDSGVFGGDGDGTATEAEFLQAVGVAENQIKSVLGFDLLDDVDLFATPPLLDDSTSDAATQAAALNYRMATEMAVAVAASLQADAAANGSSATVQDVLGALADDLSDGLVDGNSGTDQIADLADVSDVAGLVSQDPSLLTVPGTDIAPDEIIDVLISETSDTGSNVDVTALEDGTVANPTPAPATLAADSDGDDIADNADNCPAAANAAQIDTDGDAQGNACDSDDDNDQVADLDDAFPLDPSESVDTDADGIGNNADNDDDGDQVADDEDAFPLDPTETLDNDADGIGDNADLDDDNDQVPDAEDAFPFDPTESADSDGDGVGNNTDADDDNDGVLDDVDAFPTDPNETTDTDGDGAGDNADADDDGDNVNDDVDNCPFISNADQADSNGNGVGDACDGQGAVWNAFNWNEADWQ